MRHADTLLVGSPIAVRTGAGSHIYQVSDIQVVEPDEVSVLDDAGYEMLVITTCHPWRSTAKRLIITATLQEHP